MLITISHWPSQDNPNNTHPHPIATWQWVVRETVVSHVLDSRIPGIGHKELIHVVFGPPADPQAADQSVVMQVEIRIPEIEKADDYADRLAHWLGNAMKDRIEDPWRVEVFIHLHYDGQVYSGFWAG